MLGEPLFVDETEEFIAQTGKHLDHNEYNSLMITVTSPDRELSRTYLKKMEQLFAEYDLQNIKRPRGYIEASMEGLNNLAIDTHERE